ncbi:MAG: hypothetical protein COV45_03470 [Deltaproteobacteria bacterium CG11_big_fil_rev_8_21_14_0_20_47_16]|nr:MAG: hypothetical protein COV45_03470 [Deltaproteobacteria bacterium CG11_big_fil_rev_8_21_14_0_20_47_16]
MVKKRWVGLVMLWAVSAVGKDMLPPPECNIKPTQAVTTPAPVNIDQLIQDLNALTTSSRIKMLKAETLRPVLQQIFDTSHVNSKLQQFYRLLNVIAENSLADIGMGVQFDVTSARKILVTAKVFQDPAFPAHITKIYLVSTDSIPQYTVSFDKAVQFPLNQGKGFKSWDDGYCQYAKELVFEPQFSFKMKESRDGNLKVYKFQGVDLYGDFGTRGVVDVSLRYVRLAEVEFIKNTNLGRVKAYISKKEFQENKHNALLRLVSQIVPNTSLQAIDW